MLPIKTVMIMQILLLVGCVNKKTPDSNILYSTIKDKYKAKLYRQVIKLVNQLETYYPDLDCTREALIMAAKSCFALGKESKSKFYLTECIKLCDFLITTDEEYAKQNNLYLLRVRAYFNLINTDISRCTEMAIETLDSIKSYRKNTGESKTMIDKKEIDDIEYKCNQHLIKKDLRMFDILFRNRKYAPALDQINTILESYNFVSSQVLYEKMRVLMELNCDADTILDLLSNANDIAKSKDDQIYVEQGINLIEKHFKLNSIQKARLNAIKKHKKAHMA